MSRVLPILFDTEMVRAILDGRKTVTRRKIDIDIVNQFDVEHGRKTVSAYINPETGDCFSPIEVCTYQPGDILYVRETWFYEQHMETQTAGKPDLPSGRYSHRYIYKADNPDYLVNIGVGAAGWRPSIHMPKEAARIWLKVTNVRVERLQDIDGRDILAEGIDNGKSNPANGRRWENMQREAFSKLWNSTIDKKQADTYGWKANPFVWVIEFERCEKPEILGGGQ